MTFGVSLLPWTKKILQPCQFMLTKKKEKKQLGGLVVSNLDMHLDMHLMVCRFLILQEHPWINRMQHFIAKEGFGSWEK